METTLPSRDRPAFHIQSKLATISFRPPVPDNDGNCPLESPQFAVFYHTLSVPVLPNHLISTRNGSVLKLCFKRLETERDRPFGEMRIVNGVLTNGTEVIRNTLSRQSSKKGVQFRDITSSTMSSWFEIILISSIIFSNVFKTLKRTAHMLPGKLQFFFFSFSTSSPSDRLMDHQSRNGTSTYDDINLQTIMRSANGV